MRKIIVPAIMLFALATPCKAQILKGSIFLGGDLSGYTQKSKSETGSDFNAKGITIAPVFGVFTKDNMVIGGSIGFYLSDTKNESDIEATNTGYNADVFIRKYKNIGSGGFYVFGQVGLTGAYFKQETDAPDNSYDDQITRKSIGISAYPGISFAVSKRFHLETGFNDLVSLYYFKEERKENNPNISGYNTNGFGLYSSLNNATSSFYVGFRVLLSK